MLNNLKTDHMDLHSEENDKDSNTVWLFHGTSSEAAELITRGDFLVDKAGSNAGTLYGRGIYLAESCSKSDEYSHENSQGHRCILLCRAILGNILYNDDVSPNLDCALANFFGSSTSRRIDSVRLKELLPHPKRPRAALEQG